MLGQQLAAKFLSNDLALKLLGGRGEKRALTYGDIETPGDAAAAAAMKATDATPGTSPKAQKKSGN